MLNPRFVRIAGRSAAALGVILVAIQFIPSSFDRTNPPVTGEPLWDSPATRASFMTACGDCHSNETRYPWYSTIAPGSWLIEQDIRDGRRHFNVSEWDKSQRGGDDAPEEVQRGSMPIGPYLLLHPEANYNAATKIRLADGLRRTFGSTRTETNGHSE